MRLTKHERNLIRLMADGLATKQIASELGLTHATIETYVNRAKRKLGGPMTAAHLISIAYQKGILKP